MSSVVVNGVAMDNVYVNGVLVFTAGWDLSGGASYDSISKLILPPVTTVSELFFKPDGTRMYVVGTGTDTVHQFSLGTAWNVGSANYDGALFSLFVGGQTGGPRGLVIDTTGTKLYVVGQNLAFTGHFIYQYNLGTAWDLSTGSYSGISKSISPATTSDGLAFSSDGTHFYIAAGGADIIYQFNLSAWNIGTAGYSGKSFSVATQETQVQSVQFSSSGNQMYIIGWSSDTVYEYQLNTAWDVSTVVSTPSGSFSPGQGETFPTGVSFKTDGTKMYITGFFKDTVYQYSM